MKITIELELSNTAALAALLALAQSQNIPTSVQGAGAQPEVASNAGSSALVSSLTEGAAVSEGAVVAGETPEAKTAPSAPEKKRGRPAKPKEEAAAPVEKPVDAETAPTVSAATTEPAPAKEATIDDVRAALQGFTAKNGVPAGIDLLKEFGAARISELKEADYAAFVEKCGG